MVQLESEASARPLKAKAPVKLEPRDFAEEDLAPLSKRSRPSDEDLPNRWSCKASLGGGARHPSEEPSPLGLRLRKSPSFLDQIQTALSQESTVASPAVGGDPGRKRDAKGVAAADKLKASNFPALALRIGTWECISRHEGDLVAKCYFAKHKLVWEVLDGSLKSKIEIQWSDITAMKATCPENGPGTLDIVMAKQPLFFRETNPQPRKHTLWQATCDFTGGQASIHRRHFLQCAPSLLSKHFEKLIRSDHRLYALSQQPEFVLDSPYFEPRCSIFEGHRDACHELDHGKCDYGSDFPGFCDASSISAPSSSSKSGLRDPNSRMETPSPISGVNSSIVEEDTNFHVEKLRDPNSWASLKIPGLHPSMSMTDLVNHIGNRFSGKSSEGDQVLSGSSPVNQDMLEEIAHYLLGDVQSLSASDEKSLMVRVDSLCRMLQDPSSIQNIVQTNNAAIIGSGSADEKARESTTQSKPPLLELGAVEEVRDERMPPPAISRKDSFVELLAHLPRIASQPCIFFDK